MKKKTRVELERRIMELEAQLPSRFHDSARNLLLQTGRDKLTGSGLILTIEKIGGGKIVKPTMINDGLSDKTIESLIGDIKRTYNQAMDFKV